VNAVMAGGILGLPGEGKVQCLLMSKMLMERSDRVEINVTMLDMSLCTTEQCLFRDELAL